MTNPGHQSSGNLHTRKDMPQQAIAMVNQMPLPKTNPIVGKNKNCSLSVYIAIIFASVSGLLKYTRDYLCQRGIRLCRTRVANPNNPSICSASNRGILVPSMVCFLLPYLQTFTGGLDRINIGIPFEELQEFFPAQFPVNRHKFDAAQIRRFPGFNRLFTSRLLGFTETFENVMAAFVNNNVFVTINRNPAIISGNRKMRVYPI